MRWCDLGPQAVNNADDGNWTGDMTRDNPSFAGHQWTTYAERLQDAGISWRVYQEYDNYGDNSLPWFAAFRYDRSVTCDADAGFLRRIAGHVETGLPSTSDPAIGAG